MRAIVIEKPGGPEVLVVRDVPSPEPGPGQVRVRIHATAVNRADILQRKGSYPAPADAPQDIPGLEIAGEVDAIGLGTLEWKIGDRVYGVVGGGGYAEQVVVHARTLARIPGDLDYAHAAAIPEAFVTAYDAMVVQAGLSAGETVLIHAAGSGVGTAAVQIARAIGARSIGTARTQTKLDRAKTLGLEHGIVPANGAFAEDVQRQGGADVVLDLVGGAYTAESVRASTLGGRIMVVGLVAGAQCELDLGLVLRKRISIRGTMLRNRPLEEKIDAANVLAKNLSPLVASGALRPVVDRVLPLEKAGDAHRAMEQNEGFGKLVLTL